mmetsp:Transcript_4467/g.10775  ORF Transcript_4467/g.10775 Transcript_4467/m.10775 type:complete len:395 (-) Transcript_4467:266-1450(-)
MPSSKFSSHHGVKPKRVSMLKYGLPLCLAFVITINFSVIWKIETNATRRGDSAKLFALDTFHKIENARGQEKLPKGKPSEGTSAQIPDKFGELPSAKLLLDMKPPFEDSDIIKLHPAESESKPLKQSANTIVTGYFRIRSKHSSNKYDGWMRNMLSLQDAMVIFTEPALVDQIKKLRSHAIDRTILVPLSGGLDDLPIGKLFSESFWKDQLERDPEKKIHRSYQVFWIWLSKSWFVTQAIRMNMFGSDVFVWSDIGCFRDGKYNSKTMVEHREVIPRHEILQMAHHRPNPPSEKLFNDKYEHKKNFYHSGSQFAGYKDTMVKFHEHFLEIVDRFLEKNMIIVEDQAILQSVCLSYPEICAYAPFTQVKDNHYFGLRHVLHHGDTIDYWRGSSKK